MGFLGKCNFFSAAIILWIDLPFTIDSKAIQWQFLTLNGFHGNISESEIEGFGRYQNLDSKNKDRIYVLIIVWIF